MTAEVVGAIAEKVGLAGLVVYWVLFRLEKKIDAGFKRTNRRLTRLGVATTTVVKTLHGDDSDDEPEDD
jgi:hypothetical protein